MHRFKQTLAASSTKSGRRRLCDILKPPQTCGTDLGFAAAAADFSSKLIHTSVIDKEAANTAIKLQGIWRTACARQYSTNTKHMVKDVRGVNGISVLGRRKWTRECMASIRPSLQININYKSCSQILSLRPFSSTASERPGENSSESKKDVSTIEDPFDSPTYNIPEKPVTFVEGASYSFIILAGLAVAAVAAYAVFKELIFEPKEYKIFGKALERVKNDGQVKVRIGTPITGYGQESKNRAARQQIPNRMWTDENGTEHVEINFHIRGPRGGGIVYAVMHKDKADKQWKYTSLIVQIRSPSTAQLILESYIPAPA